EFIPFISSVLDIHRPIAQPRLGNRKKIRDPMEDESDEFHQRVIRAYRQLAKDEPKRVVLIDGRSSVDAVEQQIWNALAQRFPDLGKHQTPNIKLQTS